MNKEQNQSFSHNLLVYFARAYPGKSLAVVLMLVLAGFVETLGIGALLPLVSMVIETEQTDDNLLQDIFTNLFAFAGLELTLENLMISIVVLMTAKAAIVFWALRYASYISADIAYTLRFDLIKALMNSQWPYFTSLPSGLAANAISIEAQRAGQCYLRFGRTLAAFIQALVYVIAALLVSWKVSVTAMIIGGVMGITFKSLITMARRAGQDMTQSTNDMLAHLNDSLAGIKPLKAMAKEKNFLSLLDHDINGVRRSQKKQLLSTLLMQMFYEPLAIILLCGGLYYVLQYTQTPIPYVFLLAFLFYRLLGHIRMVQLYYQSMVTNESAVWSLDNLRRNAAERAETLHGGDIVTLQEGIKLDNVSLSYDGRHKVFENFSCDIPARKNTVLFGPSGIGKTTLIDAILGLVPPQSGTITVDGKPLDDIDIAMWRKMTGYVPQETFLFHDTIKNNVSLGEENFSDDDIKNALTQANAMDFIDALPEGINTIAGERGGKLSGGQRQRIALARALIRKPALLILDEATTGLDKESEKAVLAALETLKGKTTIIMISHDPAIKTIADHVIELGKEA